MVHRMAASMVRMMESYSAVWMAMCLVDKRAVRMVG